MKDFWLLPDKANRLIFINDTHIYLGNPKNADSLSLEKELRLGNIPKNLFSIPFSYLAKIESPEQKKYIQVFYNGDAKHQLNIENQHTKKEVFDLLKIKLPNFNYHKEKPPFLKHSKPPLLAMLIMTLLYSYLLYLSLELDQGTEFEFRGGRGSGLGAMFVGLASLGVFKITVGYFSVMAIAIYSFYRKAVGRTLTEYLILK